MDITLSPPRLNFYRLRNDQAPRFIARFRTPYLAITAVVEHQTGLPSWDVARDVASGYVENWHRHRDENLAMRLLRAVLKSWVGTSMRGLVDYMEGRHGYFIDRFEIDRLLRILIETGELKQLPDMTMAPAELSELSEFASGYGLGTDLPRSSPPTPPPPP